MRKVRQSVHRLERARYAVRVVTAGEVDPALRAKLEGLSREWLGNRPERGFTMAMDDLFGEPEALFALAETEGGVDAFLQLVPYAGGSAYSLSAMRRRRQTPNGLIEYLIARTLECARRAGVREISLNFCVFADQLVCDPGAPRRARATRGVLLAFDRIFQLERLRSFSAKFRPDWRPRFLCLERWTDFPLVGLAYLRVESLLLPRRPAILTRIASIPVGSRLRGLAE